MHLINHSRTSKKYRSWDLSCTVQLRFVCHDETRLRITYVQHRTRWSWRPPQLWGEMRLPRTPESPPRSWMLLEKMPCWYEWISCRLQSVEVEIGLSSSSARLQWIGRPACRSISVWYCVCGLMHLELEIYTRADSAAQRLYNAVWPHMALSVNFSCGNFFELSVRNLVLPDDSIWHQIRLIGECWQHLPRATATGGGEVENNGFYCRVPRVIIWSKINRYIEVRDP